MRRLPDTGGFQKLKDSSWGERVVVPAKQTVNVEFPVPIPLSDFNTTPSKLGNDDVFAKFMGRRLSEIDGMAFFDYTHRYRVDLPNGWPEQSKPADPKP